MRTQLITLDIMEQVPEKDLISRYGEYGRIIGFQVINSEMPEEEQLLSFDGLTKATFTLHKPDGNLYIEDLDITTYSEDNVAVIALNEQMTAAEGKAHYDITLTYEDAEDGFRIITAHGNMVIDTPMAGTEEINSTSVIYGLIFPDDFQLKLTAGENITISDDNVISATGGGGHAEYIAGEGIRISGNTISLTTVVLNQLAQIVNKQNKLTAGANITINSSNVISATDTTYNAGTGISISSGVISNTAPGITYTAGDNISIEGTEISATDTTYTAGTGLDLTGSAFGLNSATQNTLSAVAGKQDALTAGSNITISGTTISATDTTYTAGSGIAISAENVISATGGGGGSYVAGTGIDITGDTISLDSSTQSTLSDVAGKQDALTAGSNITISGTTISATDTTYSAGTGLSLSSGIFSMSDVYRSWSEAGGVNIGAPSSTYDPTATYSVGDEINYLNSWYRCTTDITVPEAWDPSHWYHITAYEEITTVNQNLAELIKSDEITETTSASFGNIATTLSAETTVILDVYCSSNTYAIVPFVNSGNWTFHVEGYSDHQAVKNTQVTLVYRYATIS